MTRAGPVDGDDPRARRRGLAAALEVDWLTAPGTPAALARELVEALRSQGVEMRGARTQVDRDALLGFVAVDEALLDAVRSASAQGRRRVLAVALGQGPNSVDLWHVVRACSVGARSMRCSTPTWCAPT
jgi:hypothetical protein